MRTRIERKVNPPVPAGHEGSKKSTMRVFIELPDIMQLFFNHVVNPWWGN
jgi:hypothetical protein